MKILVLNGSPKKSNSNTMKLTNKFLEGLNSINKNSVNILNINELRISSCKGCFNCWTRTPGKCVINDDMDMVLKEYLESDLIIWSFPLYYFSMPSQAKALLDRLLPLNLPFMDNDKNNGASHVERYDTSNKKYVLISTCGFHSKENNYEGLVNQFEILYGKEKLTKILCTEGELLRVEEVNFRTKEYLDDVYIAGKEYGKDFRFSKDTESKLNELFFPPEVFIDMANTSWNIEEENNNHAEILIKQMKNIYNPKYFRGNKELILEFYFTDLSEKFQLVLNNKECKFLKNNFLDYTTKIETSFDIWQDISKGKIKGDEALAQGKYRVLGDINTMMNFGLYFGKEEKKERKQELETKMLLIFLPWIFFWTMINFNSKIAGILTILVSAIIPFFSARYKITIYEKLTIIFSNLFGLLSILNYFNGYLYSLSFMFMGTMWIGSLFYKYPLTSEYSINNYADKSLKENSIFLQTNKILTGLWGVIYYLMGIFSILKFDSWVNLIINNAIPLLMLVFTNYFAKEYPKFLMSKNISMER